MPNTELEESFLLPEKRGIGSRFEDIVPSPSDKGVILWRYLDLAKLITLINKRKLHLIRTDVFKDKHEGSITNPMVRALKKQFKGKPFNPVTLSNFRKKLKESTFVSCWCMGTTESEAMWKLYCGEENGVAITAIYQNIEAALPDSSFHMALVQYLDYQNEGFPQGNLIYPFFHKRQAFAHEKEVRIVWIAYDQLEGRRVENPPTNAQYQKELEEKAVLKEKRGITISIDLDVIKTIQEIVVHPDAPDWYFTVIKEVVERFIPELIGRVRWSSMRSEALF